MKNVEKHIRESAKLFTVEMIRIREEFEGENLTSDDIIKMNTAITSILRKMAEQQPKDRFFFHYKWDHQYNGRDYGFKYIAHYVFALFCELAEKRYYPKEKNLSDVMKIAHKLKREGRAKDQSAAMVKSYKIIERAGKLRTDSIQDECDDIIYTCEMGLWNNIQTHYPCLMTGMNGVYNISKPKKEAVILIAQITKHFCSFIGYKG